MRGFKPYAEIYYNKRKGSFSFHISTMKFDRVFFIGYLNYIIHELLHPQSYNDKAYDTAKPEHRKKLNKKR